MGWLKRLFGKDKPSGASTSPAAKTASSSSSSASSGESIPPERVGLNGEYDQSGLAKRVALAFDEDSSLDDIETLYVAQTSGTVVLKGSVPDQKILDKMVSVAKRVDGATSVDTDQVTVS